MKKNKIRRLLCSELARFDSRFQLDIKKLKGEINLAVQLGVQNCKPGAIDLKDVIFKVTNPGEFERPPADRQKELTKLPEEWFIKTNKENIFAVEEWLGDISFSYVYSNKKTYTIPCPGYTEITTEQFKKWVLKKDKQPELIIGKWYQFGGSHIMHVTDVSADTIFGYGFFINKKNSTVWVENVELELWRYEGLISECPIEKIKLLLVNEAVKRGFVKGIIFKGVDGNERDSKIPIREIEFAYPNKFTGQNKYGLYSVDSWIFLGGEWAEIIPEAEKEIDWNKPAYLKHTSSDIVVLSTGEQSLIMYRIDDLPAFSGVNIRTLEYRIDWICENFELYTGEPLTVNNP